MITIDAALQQALSDGYEVEITGLGEGVVLVGDGGQHRCWGVVERERFQGRRGDLVRHHLAHTVRPGTGRLLVSDYTADPATGHPAAPETLRSLGFRVAGQTSGGDRPGRVPVPTAWITAGG